MALFTGHTITPDSALGGTQIQRSLRIFQGTSNVSSGSFYYRTFANGNKRTFTISVWFKKCGLVGNIGDDSYTIISCGGGGTGSYAGRFGFDSYSSDQLQFVINNPAPTNHARARSTRRCRDNAWYHAVLAYDSTQATETDRMKMYINGELETMDSPTYPSQNYEGYFNNNVVHRVGATSSWSTGQDLGQFNGYLAEFHFIDGTTYDASYFGFTEQQTGIWRPKIVTGLSYGTNGFYLDFKDNTSTTTLGLDKGGQSNNFTPHDVSVSAGIDNDSMIDTPTNNWCVWNQLSDVGDISLSEGNLKAVSGSDSWPAIFGTHGASSGKWYYEAVGADNTRWGLGWSTEFFKSGTSNTFSVGHFAYSQDPLTLYQDGSNVAINGTPAFTTGNVLQIAIDIDNGKTWFGINNTWVNASNGSAGDPAAGTNPTITFSEKGQKHYPKMINNLGNVSVNFGQQGFTYTPPDGFQALNSINLATANRTGVIRPQRHFDTLTYSGTGSSNSVTGLEFAPDLIWVKRRNASGHHHLWVDTIRGGSKSLMSNSTDSENSNANRDMTFLKDGIRWNSDTGNANASGGTYVVWCWKAGGASVSNTNGNITSSVSVNEESGFSIVSYTGNGSNGQTVGHGLSQAPQWIILKARDATQNWRVWHHKLAADGSKRLILDQNNVSENAGFLNDTAPTSTVFTLGNADDAWNANSAKFIAYCWHEVPGYSKFGSYKANGDSNGPYVHCGFRPAWVLIKNTSLAQPWVLMDNKINPHNLADTRLSPSSSDGDHTSGDNYIDFLADGFKVRSGSSTDINYSTSYPNHIFMAFAERPSGTMFGLDANAR